MRLFFDTSCLMKRYVYESGSEIVDELFEKASEIIVSPITKIEALSVCKRIQYEKIITDEDYLSLKVKIIDDLNNMSIIPWNIEIEDTVIKLYDKYQLKSLDAIQLGTALTQKTIIDYFVLSDKKLKNIFKLENLQIIDPNE